MSIDKFLEEKAVLIDKTIEKYIPRKFTKDAVLFKTSPPSYSISLDTINKVVAEPIWEFLDRGGKRPDRGSPQDPGRQDP